MATAAELKRAAAEEALKRVAPGMRLGLGTGSTVAHFLDLLGHAVQEGRLAGISGVPTSHRTADHARRLGIPLAELDGSPLDLAVDGADEVDPALNLIKGMGGALLREKMVAQAAKRFVIVVDASKEVERLGTRSALPVEVVPYGWKVHLDVIRGLGGKGKFRRDDNGRPIYTDNGNIILDCDFEAGVSDPFEVERVLRSRAGVVATGLFLGLTHEVLVAHADGVRSRTLVEAGS